MEANRIIMYEGKPCIKGNVIMLPTENKTDILKAKYIKESANRKKLTYKPNLSYKHQIIDRGYIYQHLYITTDDEIKKGDWFIKLRDVYPTGLGAIHKCEKNRGNEKRTDKGWALQVKYGNEVVLKKIIATTDKSLKGVAQPSQAFIEAYVKADGIDEVLVEYKKLVVRSYGSNVGESEETLMLKIDSHNTITIHPIKNSWNRQEVYQLCRHTWNVSVEMPEVKFIDWINKNLN